MRNPALIGLAPYVYTRYHISFSLFVYLCTGTIVPVHRVYVCVYACMYVCMYVCMYACMYAYTTYYVCIVYIYSDILFRSLSIRRSITFSDTFPTCLLSYALSFSELQTILL